MYCYDLSSVRLPSLGLHRPEIFVSIFISICTLGNKLCKRDYGINSLTEYTS